MIVKILMVHSRVHVRTIYSLVLVMMDFICIRITNANQLRIAIGPSHVCFLLLWNKVMKV